MKITNPTTSVLAEIPEALAKSAQTFLNDNPDYDYDRMVTEAIALFLMRNKVISEGDYFRIMIGVYFVNLKLGGTANES